ncbi:MAG: helix-turn-helix domain-containing protein [Pyrinomonadaceae bacterium]|nr:helix-turn-helix domain-containing protein [Pyrinomonadaceae bacterium]
MANKKRVEKSSEGGVPGDLITQSEAADLSGRSVAALNELIRRGRLRSFPLYGRNLVSRADILTFKPSPGGRPPKANLEQSNGKKRGKK